MTGKTLEQLKAEWLAADAAYEAAYDAYAAAEAAAYVAKKAEAAYLTALKAQENSDA